MEFENGIILCSDHYQDCCEWHYLSFKDLYLDDFNGLEFDLTNDDFFERIPDYGIALKPKNGHSIKIPGYGSNNGYYSSNLTLVIEDSTGKIIKEYDITECQEWVE